MLTLAVPLEPELRQAPLHKGNTVGVSHCSCDDRLQSGGALIQRMVEGEFGFMKE
jgi:hypothetical protein